jgi:hypothetical protein
MSATDFTSAAEKYLNSRDVLRARAKEEFYSRNPAVGDLISAINEYVAKSMLSLSGQDMRPILHGLYICDLVVSFTRTHFVVVDLLVCSELTDAATLLRKQFELLARLNELSTAETIDHLLKRTPNLSALKTKIKALYGEYSQVAHSSAPQPLQLLGRMEHEWGERTVVYPVFQENAYVSMQHVTLTVLEYYLWSHQFFSDHCEPYDSGWGSKWLSEVVEKHEAVFSEG